MKYPYMVKYNGTYYPAGVDVPNGEKAQNEPLTPKVDNSPNADVKAEETAKKPIKKASKKE